MAEWCLERTSKEAIEELNKERIPVGEVLKAKEIVNEPHILASNLFKEVAYPNLDKAAPIVTSPVELSENPGEIRTRAPLLGEHTDQILTELGYSEKEISEFKEKRIV